MSEDTVGRFVGLLEEAVAAMTLAGEHCRVAQVHYRSHERARAAAHSLSAHGHLLEATERLGELARLHAAKSTATI
jgi:hypothetical protein